VASRKLLDVSEVEQTLAVHQDQGDAMKQLEAMFQNPEIQSLDLLRFAFFSSLSSLSSPSAYSPLLSLVILY